MNCKNIVTDLTHEQHVSVVDAGEDTEVTDLTHEQHVSVVDAGEDTEVTDLAHEQHVSVVVAGEDTSGRCNHITSGTIQTSAHYLTFPALQHNALIAETTHSGHEDQTHCWDTV